MGWPHLDELPIAPVSGLLVVLSPSCDLVLVYMCYLVGAWVPLAPCGAGRRVPDVGPVSFLDLHSSCSVFLIVGAFHLLLGSPNVVPRLLVVSSSGGCGDSWQFGRNVPVKH